MKKLQFILAALMVVVAGALCSCSKSSNDELIANIPADSDIVLKLNLKQIVENAGGSVDNGRIILPEKLQSLANTYGVSSNVNTVISCLEGIDVEEIYFVYMTRKKFVSKKAVALLAYVTDKQKLEESLTTAGFEYEKMNGFDKYEQGGFDFYIDGNILWVADDVNEIEKLRKSAADSNISQVPALSTFLSAHNAFDCVANLQTTMSEYNINDANWLIGNLKFENQAVLGEAVVTNADGKLKQFGEAFGEIDTDFLRYVPGDANFVMAIGEVKNAGLRSLMGMAASKMGPFSDLLATLNGTTAAAIQMNMNADLYEAIQRDDIKTICENMNIIAMAHYPQTTIDNTLSMLRGKYTFEGWKLDEYGRNGFSVNVPINYNCSVPVYFGDADGNLAIANFPFNANCQNSFNTHFNGRRAVMYSNVSNEWYSQYGVDCSAEGCLWLESDRVKFESRFLGTDKKFLEVSVDLLTSPKFISDVTKKISSQRNKYDYDDSDFYYDVDDVIDDLDVVPTAE